MSDDAVIPSGGFVTNPSFVRVESINQCDNANRPRQ